MSRFELLGFIFLVAAAVAVRWKLLPARTNPIDGPDPIAELAPAEIGGMRRWLLIRGADRDAPILIWLHGGPGSAQMPVRSATEALERHFVVVHRDQRGAGKSNPPTFDPGRMTLNQFLADARDVTDLMRARLGDQPIIVRGLSWGTMPGAWLVARWPEDHAGYVAVGQQVDTMRRVRLLVRFVSARCRGA
jgi:pimeloyl-ACP methyl ester carboxylesterase